jgi:hypothetical protein
MMRAGLLAIAVLALGTAGCVEVEQAATTQKSGKYQGKPDTQPWDNAPLAFGDATWKQGDRASWENQIRTRNLAQHEYKRVQ